MATKNKTTTTSVSVYDFLDTYVQKEQQKQDSLKLIELMTKWSGFEAQMWGPTIIGFGSYQYKYASGHEGDAPIIGFSPRKPEFSLYVIAPANDDQKLLERLGKFKMGKACIYFKKLEDLNIDVLEVLCRSTINYVNENHESGCRT